MSFWDFVIKGEHWIWTRKDLRFKKKRVHRLAWEAQHGPFTGQVKVTCGVRRCLRHLTLHAGKKLTEWDVKRIRELHAKGREQKQLAREFGVQPVTVHQIVHRKIWK